MCNNEAIEELRGQCQCVRSICTHCFSAGKIPATRGPHGFTAKKAKPGQDNLTFVARKGISVGI